MLIKIKIKVINCHLFPVWEICIYFVVVGHKLIYILSQQDKLGNGPSRLKRQKNVHFRFILLHIAFILNVIALATPYWVYAPTYNHSISNSSHDIENSTSKGLWKICVEGDCSYFDTSQPGS